MNQPPIYNRIFKVVGGDLGVAMRAQLEQQRDYLALLEGIAQQLGAIKVHTFKETGKFAGFEFPAHACIDPTLFIERPTLVFTPKRRENRGFWRRIEAIGGSTPQDVLRKFGLSSKEWIGGKGCTIVGFYSVDVWWVIVPSRHFDDATMEIAAKFPESCTEAVRMLWQPPMDWELVTEGMYLNEWDIHYQQEIQLAQQPKQ